jgi:poly-gamma-glutamate synthesis protein (capsule biosynthesis protein)
MIKLNLVRLSIFVSILSFVLSACNGTVAAYHVTVTPVEPALATSTVTAEPPTPAAPVLWISPAVPDQLVEAAKAWNIGTSASAEGATLRLAPVPTGESSSVWTYALVAAFPTVRDGVTLDELKAAWAGNGQELIMTESTRDAMEVAFGSKAGPLVGVISPENNLTNMLWQDRSIWGIMPFGELNPKLKVLEIDGQSPIRKEFDAEKYPLKAAFGLTCDGPCPQLALPVSNRDPQKMATVVMTGVTALVRATAYKMEINGVNYPSEGIRDWLTGADIAHISNEIPFAKGCPYPKSSSTRLVFCSDPKYISLLDYVGADVIELTGNHFEDWGKEATRMTVDMYQKRNLPYFGGGVDLAEAEKPAILERNGMKFAFIGCNPAGPDWVWARSDGYPGAAPCGKYWDGKVKNGTGYEWMTDEIKKLKSEGYIVIATFQYFEYYSPDPRPWQQEDFRLMADAGADIVSGSQGHYAQAMEFYNGGFLHYGIGNLFFDQMGYDNPSNGKRTTNTRREFLDRHVFYDGKYISTELLTAMLYDYAQPRPMTPEERKTFLEEYFAASGW